MAKTRNFSVRDQAMSALLMRFRPEHYDITLAPRGNQRCNAWLSLKQASINFRQSAADWLKYHTAKLDDALSIGDPDLSESSLDRPEVVVYYNPRRTKDYSQVMSVFTTDSRLLGFVFVSDDGKGTWFPVWNPGGTRVDPTTH